ncbi:hypothetical protein Goari_027279 [Gossypium aridum]|uniref:Uncharacterized protein n=1 Tax=Gossypium aridum TaxID=34290 RepID=A0A7J8YSX7_GOSAI|nr:hypothetical protein [Gossypium aridum]
MLKELGVWEKSLVNVDGHDDEAAGSGGGCWWFIERNNSIFVKDMVVLRQLKGDNAALRYMFAEGKKLQLKDRDGDASVKFDAGAGDDCD